MKHILCIALLLGSMGTQAQSVIKQSRGNKFNPSIGINALTIYKNGSRDIEDDGMSLQELELQFGSDVDAYFRAEATIALHPEEDEASGHSHTFAIEPEEVFVETLSLPGLTVRAGKFYSFFGKYNAVHSHALPFIYRSKVQEAIFGDEGLSESGISLAYLTPLPWFSDLTIQAFQPTNETLFVDSHHAMAYVVKWKNLWDLTDSLTLEWGASALSFSNHAHDAGDVEDKTALYGSDLTLKWRPTQKGRSSSFMWSTEFIHKDRSGSNGDKNGGVTTFMRYQLGQRWYTQAQYEFLGLGKVESEKDLNAYTGLLAFVPTEFSSIRGQFDSIHDGADKPEKRISLQLNISIGAHPAHTY